LLIVPITLDVGKVIILTLASKVQLIKEKFSIESLNKKKLSLVILSLDL